MTSPQDPTHAQLSEMIAKHRVLLFMKGNKIFPACGFSATVVQILKAQQVAFETVNVLADDAVRSGIKTFSNWPTIPQLYVDGNFIGGCDIIREMDAKGQLAELLEPVRAQQ